MNAAQRLVLSSVVTAAALAVAAPFRSGNGNRACAESPDQASESLNALLIAYFTENDPDVRAGIAGQVERLANGSASAVATELGNLELWSSIPATGKLTVKGRAGALRAHWQVPRNYDPRKALPVVLCFPEVEQPLETAVAKARDILGESIDSFAIVAIDRVIDGRLHQGPGADEEFRTLIRELRRTIHTDTDRMYAFGVETGADAAWMAAIMHAELFAGAILYSGYPAVPYPAETYSLLLANLQHVPVLSLWHRDDRRPAATRLERVAAHNEAIVEIARRRSLPITGVELPKRQLGSPTSEFQIGPDALAGIFSHSRLGELQSSPAPHGALSTVSHWFRYPGQGRADWFRQLRFRGDSWDAEQISILPSPSVDSSRFISSVMQDHLAYLDGSVRDNEIILRSIRSAEIEIQLRPGLVDFSRPLRVTCNSIKRFDGPIEPSIATMLEASRQTWDFRRLNWAMLRLSIQTDAE